MTETGQNRSNPYDAALNREMEMHRSLTEANTISYQRQSVSRSEGRSKSLEDQAACNIETAEYYRLPLSLEGQWDEEKNHGGDEWWIGGPAVEENARFRPVLTKIVMGIRAGTIKCVIAWDLSRLWRSVAICGILIDTMAHHGVLLYDKNGPCDISTPDGRLKVQNGAAAAQHLRESAQVNSPRGVRKSREKGLVVVGSDTLGFRNVGNGRVRIVPDEIEIVRWVFEEYVSGKTKTTIARELTERLREQGVTLLDDVNHKRSIKRSPQTRDLVYLKQIDKILRNPRYQGLQPHEQKEWPCPAFLIDGEPAVSPHVFVEAQKRLEREKRVGNRGSAAHYLAGLFRCGFCAQTLQVNPVRQADGSQKKFWMAKQHDIRSWCTHSLPSITEVAMREYTEIVLMPLLVAEAESLLSVPQQRTAKDEIARLEAELARANETFAARVAKIFDSDGDDTNAAMRVLSDRHAKQTDALRKQIAELTAQELRDAVRSDECKGVSDELNKWDQLDHEQKRAAIHKVIRWVVLIPSEDFLGREERREKKRDRSRDAGAPPAGKVLFLTAFGTFHTAVVKRVAKEGGTFHRSLGLVAGDASECLGSAADLPVPGEFAAGLQRSYDGRGYGYRPCEVMPGYHDPIDAPIVRV